MCLTNDIAAEVTRAGLEKGLHVFCESCLDNLLIDEAGDVPKSNAIIICPTCEQTTKVSFFNFQLIATFK